MSREARCGRFEAETRLRVATAYLDTAELAATEDTPEARNVAAGNAVLAAIAASDAICCARLGRRHRGADHAGAARLLRSVTPSGADLATRLSAVLAVKAPAHYGDKFVSPTSLAKALRGTRLLLESARDIVSGA